MVPESWLAIYQTEWQSAWALWAARLGFLVYRGVLAFRESAPRAGVEVQGGLGAAYSFE